MTAMTWPVEPHRLSWIATGFAVLAVVTLVLLLSSLADTVRLSISGAALFATGTASGVCCHLRARLLEGARRRPWSLLTGAAVAAVAGNAVATVLSAVSPDLAAVLGTVGVGVALVLSIGALYLLTALYVRPADRTTTALDVVVVGGGFLIVVASVVYPVLPEWDAGPVVLVVALAFPVLDCLLATLAVIVILRCPQAKRVPLTLVGLGFLVYGVTDVVASASSGDGSVSMGSPLDVGWIVGFALIGLAALCPIPPLAEERRIRAAFSPTAGSVAVLCTCVLAVIAQGALVHTGRLPLVAGVVLTVTVVGAAGARQVLVTNDNSSLRRGLEQRVDEQTDDLRRMVSQTQTLLRSVGEGIYGVDDDGMLTFINPAGAQALGYLPYQLLGAFVHDVFHVAEDDDEHPWENCSIARSILTGAETTLTERYRRADGAQFPVDSTTTVMADHTGSIGAVVVFREAGKRLEVERMKDEFLSVLSHELRTPMTSIIGTLDILGSGELGELPAPVTRLLGLASTSSLRLARLVDDLLDTERLRSGTQSLRLEELDAAGLVSEAVQQMKTVGDQRGVALRCDRTEGRVLADADKVVQALVNLLGNAVKFSPTGAEVVVESYPVDDMVCFEVRDRGRGIPENKLASVFDRFVQVDSSDARVMGGTGLGLAISKDIVEQHGGHIEARSTWGAGTTVVFTIKAARPGTEAS